MIKINGVELVAPTDYQVGILDISKAERNAKGDMIIERIATKRKIELAFGVLTQDEVSSILKAVFPVFFKVEYIDPQEGTLKTGTFYSGDRSTPALFIKNGVMAWKGLKFNIIER